MATKRKDFTQTALDVVRRATGEVPEPTPAPAPSKKPDGGRIEAQRSNPKSVKRKG